MGRQPRIQVDRFVFEARVRFIRMLSIGATVCLVAAVPAVASEPELTVGSTDQEIRIDGSLDEPAWHQAGAIPDLTQQDPHPGAPTPFTSEVRVLVSRDAIYIGFVCHDPEPSRVAIHTMQRDGNMTGDDTVAVVIDPVADGRRGYIFRINAAAARLDGLVSGPESMSTDWDGIWDASTQRTPDGWTAEIRIPTQTLRFKWGQDRWGFNVERYVPRTLTTFRWSGITLDATFIDLQRAGRLVGVGVLRQGLGLSLAPYGLVRSEKDFESGVHTVEGEAGGDLDLELHRRPHGLPHHQSRLCRD